MTTVGSLIKSKRISKNLSIDQISKELKIQKNILQKIENDELAENINAVFIIGHLKSYSEYLEFKSECLLTDVVPSVIDSEFAVRIPVTTAPEAFA